jgi:hypothetical protein
MRFRVNVVPIAVGGIGGSGTRVVAKILEKLGFYLGNDVNGANDNLWFTLCFKRTEILSATDVEFSELVNLFVDKMTGSVERNERLCQLLDALANRDRPQHSREWLNKRVQSFLDRSTDRTGRVGQWGWKEPNTHVVIGRFRQHVPRLKYIHVIRNGLDMAYSMNQNQLFLWGPAFLGEDFGTSPRHSLKFWCLTHRKILAEAETMGPDFLLLDFEELCRVPERSVKALLEFLDVKTASQGEITAVTQLIHPPESLGRYRRHGTQTFDPEDLAYVRQLGFDLDDRL